jgi:hypothetical protein
MQQRFNLPEDEAIRVDSAARGAHDEQVRVEAERVAAQHAEVDVFRVGDERGEPEAVVNYSSMVLAAKRKALYAARRSDRPANGA